MSFGFGVGDFIAVSKLIKDITSCLQSVGGAKSEYQELIREFEALDAALRHLDQLKSNTNNTTGVDSIKCAALLCRLPLEEFLAKARPYEGSLGIWNRSQTLKNTTDKIAWAFGRKDDIRRLQIYLSVHVGTINMLLAQHGFEQMNTIGQRAEEASTEIQEQLETNKKVLDELSRSSSAQALLLHTLQSMVGGLYNLVCGDMRTSLEYFTQAVGKVCVTTQQIYTVVLDIRESMTTVDTRWTFFQEPWVVEDALGRKHAVASESDYGTLNVLIRHWFKEGTGCEYVVSGEYELYKTKKRTEAITAATRIIPGMAITMALIIHVLFPTDLECPMRRCRSEQTTPCPGGGFKCSACGVYFDRATETSIALQPDWCDPDVVGMSIDVNHDGLKNVKWAPIIFNPSSPFYHGGGPEYLKCEVPGCSETFRYRNRFRAHMRRHGLFVPYGTC